MQLNSLHPKTLGRAYLAGPMSGKPELNFPAFIEATAFLRAHGYKLIPPHEHLGPLNDSDLEYSLTLGRDIMLLSQCDSIILLPGWEESRGASLEHQFAVITNKIIVEYDRIRSFFLSREQS